MIATAIEQLLGLRELTTWRMGYHWCYWSDDPIGRLDAGEDVALRGALSQPDLRWLDVEQREGWVSQGHTVEWLARAVDHLERYGRRVAIYCSKASWLELVGDSADAATFGRLPLVLAQYNYRPTLRSDHLPFCGWTSLAGHQYTGATGDEVDLDVFSPAVLPPMDCSDQESRIAAAVSMLDRQLRRPRVRKAPVLAARVVLAG